MTTRKEALEDIELTGYTIWKLITLAFLPLIHPPTNCSICGWPTGGKGNYRCLCQGPLCPRGKE
jgi:hypothetical protein